jgi:streptomycin 6-kinase
VIPDTAHTWVAVDLDGLTGSVPALDAANLLNKPHTVETHEYLDSTFQRPCDRCVVSDGT